MLSLTDRAAAEAAITDTTLDPALRDLLASRVRQLVAELGPDVALGDIAHFHLAGPGDAIADVERAVGVPVAGEGDCFRDPSWLPPWEWIDQAGCFFAIVFVVSDGGFGHVVYVPDQSGVDAQLLALCRWHATAA